MLIVYCRYRPFPSGKHNDILCRKRQAARGVFPPFSYPLSTASGCNSTTTSIRSRWLSITSPMSL